MTRFLIRRLAWAVVVLWFVVSATFAIAYLLPADPAAAAVGPHADAATVERVRGEMCLDRSFFEQYGCYVGRMAGGDLGTSMRTGQSVWSLLSQRILPTLELALAAIALQILIGIPLGMLAASRKRRLSDWLASGFATVAQSAPAFFVGPLLMFVLGHQLGWFPVSGRGEGGLDRLWHLFLPALTLALVGMAYYVRLTRAEMLTALESDYIRTARAKGVSQTRVVVVHGGRNAMPPLLTIIGLDLGALMGGAVVVEYVFQWPGLGREAVAAIFAMDLPVVLGVVLLSAIAILLANLLADLGTAVLDPRVRLE